MKLKPSASYALFALFLIFFGYLFKDKVVDIQLHDFYFVLDYFFISLTIGFWAIINGTIYFLAEKNKVFSSGIIGFISFGFCILGLLFIVLINSFPVEYAEFNTMIVNDFLSNKILIIGLIGIFFLFASMLITFVVLLKVINKVLRVKSSQVD